jgi:hypothetical protein
VIHAVHFALAHMQLFYQVAPASAKAFQYLAIEAGFMKSAYSFYIPGTAARVTHICDQSFKICAFHI